MFPSVFLPASLPRVNSQTSINHQIYGDAETRYCTSDIHVAEPYHTESCILPHLSSLSEVRLTRNVTHVNGFISH